MAVFELGKAFDQPNHNERLAMQQSSLGAFEAIGPQTIMDGACYSAGIAREIARQTGRAWF